MVKLQIPVRFMVADNFYSTASTFAIIGYPDMLLIASKCSYNIGLLQMMLTTSNVYKSCFVYLKKK